MSPLRIGVLALLACSCQITARALLPPPRNLTLLSEDFGLFLTWLPEESYPPEVTYTVQWKDPYYGQWEDVPHCRDISGSRCNVTCVPTELNNRYWVQVRAQLRGPAGTAASPWVTLKSIDYILHVEPAPPMLQLHMTENTLGVNATFSYPSCAKDIFQHQLSYDLEVLTAGTEKKKKFDQLKETVIELNTTQWGSGNYCLHAKSYFQTNGKWSGFSRPLCTQLHGNGAALQGPENWIWIILPLLLMMSAVALGVFWYQHMYKETKMPQALDFSTFQAPKTLLEFGHMEVITLDPLYCTAVPRGAAQTNRSPHRVHLPRPRLHSLSEDEEEEEEDDSGSPTPYIEMHRFRMKGSHSQTDSEDQKMLYRMSKSGSVPLHGGGVPAATVSGPSVSTVRLAENAASGSSGSRWDSLSENSLADNPLDFPIASPAARGEGQEDANGDVDCWPCSPTLDSIAPLKRQVTGARDPSKVTCGTRGTSWLLQGQLIGLESLEKDLRSCRALVEETPLLTESRKQDTEDAVPAGEGEVVLLYSPRFHGYEPRRLPYLARARVA